MTGQSIQAEKIADWLLANGRTSVTTGEAAELLGISAGDVRKRLNAPARRHELVSPARGLWIPVPPQFRTWGAPPGAHVVDQMMKHLQRDYYLGWLSAAELHGAAHQRPQTFQVAVDRRLADRQVGRTRFSFRIRADAAQMPRIKYQVPTGYVWLATPELTVLDLCNEPGLGAGLSNIATVLAELIEDNLLGAEELAQVSEAFPAAAGRRAGWLIDLVSSTLDTGPLARAVRHRSEVPTPLRSDAPDRGAVDRRWWVRVNGEVEPDL